jgi:endonuclease G
MRRVPLLFAPAFRDHPSMKKRPSSLLPFALAVVALFTPEAQGRPCRDFFAGGQPPVLANPKLAPRTTLLCNGGYAVLASGLTRGALWSAEYLTVRAIEVARYTPRAGQFHPDNRLSPEDRAELRDYVRSGYDRGHMTPSGDMPDAESSRRHLAWRTSCLRHRS